MMVLMMLMVILLAHSVHSQVCCFLHHSWQGGFSSNVLLGIPRSSLQNGQTSYQGSGFGFDHIYSMLSAPCPGPGTITGHDAQAKLLVQATRKQPEVLCHVTSVKYGMQYGMGFQVWDLETRGAVLHCFLFSEILATHSVSASWTF